MVGCGHGGSPVSRSTSGYPRCMTNYFPPVAPFSAGRGATTAAVPPNACDCHIHLYDRRYPAAPEATLRPPDATPPDYRRLQARIRTERVVVVTPSTYGADNRPTIDALRAFGARARGVAVIAQETPDIELEQLHASGVRGARLNLVHGRQDGLDLLEQVAARIGRLRWHLQLLARPDALTELAPRLAKLPVQIVFDHFGNVPADAGITHPAFAVISALQQQGRAWVKLSGAASLSRAGASAYADMATLAKAYIAAAPDRVLWGSDWPHPANVVPPDDAVLMDRLADWAGDAATLRRILVDNPARLYDF